MSPPRWPVVLGLALVLAAASAASGQQTPPRIGYVYPAGGQQGATIEITIGGQFLDGVSYVHVGGGIKATVVEHIKPITQQQFGQLRERLGELQKKEKDAATIKEIADITRQIAVFVKRSATPALAETVRLQVTVAADAEPGKRELRLGTPNGLSNPRAFYVGQLAEFSEAPSTSTTGLNILRELRNRNQLNAKPPSEMTITLPAIVNGQILPGGINRYRFRAARGMRLVAAARARDLIPYLADAVPGWFQASLTLYDGKGNELTFADHFRFDPDPVLYYEIPSDGEYLLEIRDTLYRGRDDFVYRITAGELPFVTGIFPLGGRAGTQTAVEVSGWNLPAAQLTEDARDKGPGIYPLAVRKGDWVSNAVPFAADDLPECAERKPDGSRENSGPQPVTLPVIVNGRIEQPGQWDVFRIEGRAGETIVAEVHARRLGSPLDSVLKLTDANGKQLAFNDDCEDKGCGLNTHHADSYLRATLPAAGSYFVHVGDAQRQGGPEYAYRLRISPPRPDFELRVAPSSVNVRGGASVPLAVYALRRDGFADEITLALKGAAAGFALAGGRLAANQDQVRVTLTAPPAPLKEPVSLSLEGRASIQGQTVVRPVVPAEDMMQAFAYRHLVVSKELDVAVAGRYPPRAEGRVLGATPVKIPAGGTARVQVSVPARILMGRLQLELNEPPDGIAILNVAPVPAGSEIVLRSDAAKIKPGLQANLIVNVFLAPNAPTSAPTTRPQANANQRRRFLGTLPAIPFEIVAPGAGPRQGAAHE